MRMIKKVKLIIEVDEKYYEACKDAVEESYPSQIEEVIANGIPLPRGHGRLIDADAYIDKQEDCGWLDDIPISEFNRITPTIVEADKENNNETDN